MDKSAVCQPRKSLVSAYGGNQPPGYNRLLEQEERSFSPVLQPGTRRLSKAASTPALSRRLLAALFFMSGYYGLYWGKQLYYFTFCSGRCFLESSLVVFAVRGKFTGISVGNSPLNASFWIHCSCKNNGVLTTAFAMQTRTSNPWTRKYLWFSICQQSVKSKRLLFPLNTKSTVICRKTLCGCRVFLNGFRELQL